MCYSVTPFTCLNASLSLSVLFLLLDRILILSVPFTHQKYRNLFTRTVIISCIVLCCLLMAIQYIYKEYKSLTNVRLLLGLMNIVLACILSILMYRYANEARVYKQFRMVCETFKKICLRFFCFLLWE